MSSSPRKELQANSDGGIYMFLLLRLRRLAVQVGFQEEIERRVRELLPSPPPTSRHWQFGKQRCGTPGVGTIEGGSSGGGLGSESLVSSSTEKTSRRETGMR